MKKILSFSLVVILLTVLAVSVSAAAFNDSAYLCSDDNYQKIADYMTSKSEELGFNITALTIDSIDGQDIQDYADLYYEDNFGYDSDGILFMLCMDTREYAFSTTGKGIGMFNDDDLEYIIDVIMDDLAEGNYAQAIYTYAQIVYFEVKDVQDNGYEVTEEGYSTVKPSYEEEDKGNSIFSPGRLIGSLLAGSAVGGISIGSMRSKLNTVHQKNSASDYVKKGSLRLTKINDRFIRQSVTKTSRSSSNNSGRSGGSYHSGGSTHVSSSGHSHGGSHGHF